MHLCNSFTEIEFIHHITHPRSAHNSVVLSIYSYVTITAAMLETLHHHPEKLYTHQQPASRHPPPPTPLSASTDLPILDTWRQRRQKTCVLRCPLSLGISQSPSMLWLLSVLHSFLLPNNTSRTDISHIIDPSISWQTLELFLVLTTRKNAALKICVQIFIQICVFISFEYIPKSKIAGSRGNLCSVFKEMPEWFPKRLHRFLFLPAVHKGAWS